MKHIVVAVIGNNDTVPLETAYSLALIASFSADKNIKLYFDPIDTLFPTMVQKNMVANRVAKSEVIDGVVFIDSRVSFSPDSFFNLITHEDLDVVYAAAPIPNPSVESYDLIIEDSFDMTKNTIPLKDAAMGFTYISKNALKKLSETLIPTEGENPGYMFFIPIVDGNEYKNEDSNFVAKLKSAGIEPVVDPTINVASHKVAGFAGNFQEQLKNTWVNSGLESLETNS